MTEGRPGRLKGSAVYMAVAAEASTLLHHLDHLRKAWKHIDAADEAYRQQAVVVVREALERFDQTREALRWVIIEAREHFGI